MKRAALYLRVSTEKQTNENQRPALEAAARARGFEPVAFEEVESAKKARPVFESVVARAKRGEFAAVFVAALDRLGRSMTGVVDTVLQLDRAGVAVVSLRETWLDLDSPVRPLLVSIFGWVAEQERRVLVERTHAGLARARRQGKKLGRPRASPIMLGSAADAVQSGRSVRAAARAFGVSERTLRRALQVRECAAKTPLLGSAAPSLSPPG